MSHRTVTAPHNECNCVFITYYILVDLLAWIVENLLKQVFVADRQLKELLLQRLQARQLAGGILPSSVQRVAHVLIERELENILDALRVIVAHGAENRLRYVHPLERIEVYVGVENDRSSGHIVQVQFAQHHFRVVGQEGLDGGRTRLDHIVSHTRLSFLSRAEF